MLSEKIPDCYEEKKSVKRMRSFEEEMEPKDGDHFYGCIQTMIKAKKDWEVRTIEHWNKRVQIQSGKAIKLNTLNKSIFDQVDSVIEDDVRWHKRCTVMRGDYDVYFDYEYLIRLLVKIFNLMKMVNVVMIVFMMIKNSIIVS